jgi:hypothetical protein
MDDPFRQGMFAIAMATARAEKEWLDKTIADLDPPGARGYTKERASTPMSA